MLTLAMAGLVGMAVLSFRALQQDVDGYREADRPALHWNVAQTEVELSELIAALARFAMQDPQMDQSYVNDRFDVLWSRASELQTGTFAKELQALDAEVGALPVLQNRMQASEDLILNIASAPDEDVRKLIADLTDVQAKLRNFVEEVLEAEQARYVSVRASLLLGKQLTYIVWASAVILAALIVGIMLIETRRYQRMLIETEDLAQQAQSADRAKSRFLSMMSHELRTPMNGVLGLMALAKQSGMSEPQTRLIEQAERAGAHMTNLLGDILDFSDLQTERLEIDHAAFQPRALGAAVNDLIEVSAKRTALELALDYAPDLPEWVVGDFARLRQALAHFCSYFMEIVGADDIRLSLSHRDGRLLCEIEIDAIDARRPGWQPEAMFGRNEDEYGDFASDSLGPTIARGLVSLMGGTVEMMRPAPDRARLVLGVPADVIEAERDCVRIETSSATTEMLVNAAVDARRWRIWDPKLDRSRVGAVLIEASLPSVEKRTERLRKLHPGARVIAIGDTEDVVLFDGICRVPIDANVLNSLLADGDEKAAIA